VERCPGVILPGCGLDGHGGLPAGMAGGVRRRDAQVRRRRGEGRGVRRLDRAQHPEHGGGEGPLIDPAGRSLVEITYDVLHSIQLDLQPDPGAVVPWAREGGPAEAGGLPGVPVRDARAFGRHAEPQGAGLGR